MDKTERIRKIAQSEDDAVLLAKVYDRIMNGIQRQIPVSTFFLAPGQQHLVRSLLAGEDIRFFGGTDEYERAVC